MPKVIALKDFISPVHGNVQMGDIFNMKSEGLADSMASAGYVKIIGQVAFAKSVAPEPLLAETQKELSIDDIKDKLRALDVSFHPRTGKDKLLQLLKDAQDGNTEETASA